MSRRLPGRSAVKQRMLLISWAHISCGPISIDDASKGKKSTFLSLIFTKICFHP